MKLPEIYKNKIELKLNNNSQNYLSNNNQENNSIEYPYQAKITTDKYQNRLTTILGQTTHYIVTKNLGVINLKDIKEIKKIKD